MNLAFGNSWNAEVASELVQEFTQSNFSDLPAIEILPSATLDEANGAFASVNNTIYLSQEFIAQNAANPEAITSLLLEETGHYIDSKINVLDAAGDEGDIFARLAQGKTIGADTLLALKAEDDTAVLKLNGQIFWIEQSTTISEVTFRTVEKNKYVVAEGGGGSTVNANRDVAGPWENFTLIDLNGGSFNSGDVVNIRTQNSRFLVAEGSGGGVVNANRTVAGPWEEFQVVKLNGNGEISSGDSIALRAKNGQYVVAEGGGGANVNANRNAIGSWEKFIINFRSSPYWDTVTGQNPFGQILQHPVGIQRVNQNGRASLRPIESGRSTWLVIHGWKGNPGENEFTNLARALAHQTGDQVLTLDWSSAARSTSFGDVAKAASWIPTVANWAAQKLRDWGYTNGSNLNINLVGHSLGAYVAAEIAQRIGGVNRIVALDPAKEFPGGYETSSIDFSANSQFSWGFYGSAAGSYQRAATADESWSVGFGTVNDAEKNHGRVVNLFASMVDQSRTNPNHSISKFFGPAQMSQNVYKPWLRNVFNDLGGNQSGYQQFEGRFEAREESGRWVPKELVYNDKQSGQLIKLAA